MATLIDQAEYSPNEIYQISQTDKVEGAAAGASFGGLGVSNEPHQQLANRTAFLYGRQVTNIGNITALIGDVGTLFQLVGLHGIATFGTPGAWSWTVPANIVRALFVLTGGGGGGSNAAGTTPGGNYSSGGGGGAGGTVFITVPVTPNQVWGGVVGAGGASESNGGSTTLVLGATTYASASGGSGASFQTATSSAGGVPGGWSVLGGQNGTGVWGGFGHEGQSAAFVKDGAGGTSRWGGGTRSYSAAAGGGIPSSAAWGAGGGGAYGGVGNGLPGQPGIVFIQY
jgi:hypothetical protein